MQEKSKRKTSGSMIPMRAGKKPAFQVTENDGGIVMSFRCRGTCQNRETLKKQVKRIMEELAEWVWKEGGIPGHIKSAITFQEQLMLSVTDKTADEHRVTEADFEIQFTAIAYMVVREKFREKVWNAFDLLTSAAPN